MKGKWLSVVSAASLVFFLSACGQKPAEQPAEKPAAPAGAPGATIDMSTVGEITGSVKLTGTAPREMVIKMGADPYCASMHKTPVHSEDVVVGENNSLENVIVYIKSGLGNYTYPEPTQPATLDQIGCMYVPHVVCVMAGQKFEVLNSDKTTHNIHVLPKVNREWNESQPASAPPIEKEFARAEAPFPVKCNIHPWMKAYIGVFDNPYFAVTGKDGAFTLKNVPPGTYTVEAWQEHYGTQDESVALAAKQTKTVDFTFKAQ
jgi:Carboxypeptidase regulatory-like domain